MKTSTAASLVAAVLCSPVWVWAAAPGSGAVSSEIAGFVALDLPATADAVTPPPSLKSLGLVQPALYHGTATAVRANSVLDYSASWTEGQFCPPEATPATATHYLEITSGPRTGMTFDILRTSAAAKTLRLGKSLPANVGESFGYCVRRHWTLAGVFGSANEADLAAGDAESADLVQIHNGTKFQSFYFSNGEAGAGWRRVGGGETNEAARKIEPDDALLIRRTGHEAVSTLIKGVIKTGRAAIAVHAGTNVIGNVYPAPLTLASSRLYTGNPNTGVRGGDAKSADKVLILRDGVYETYYYQDSTTFGGGWRLSGRPGRDVSGTEIPVGGAIILRRGGETGFVWNVPAHPKGQ